MIGTAEAEQAETSEQAGKINVGTTDVKPGDPLDIPVTLSGAQVGSVVTHVRFPKALLSYVRVERGLAVVLWDVSFSRTKSRFETVGFASGHDGTAYENRRI